jgi:hypothetical protein
MVFIGQMSADSRVALILAESLCPAFGSVKTSSPTFLPILHRLLMLDFRSLASPPSLEQ